MKFKKFKFKFHFASFVLGALIATWLFLLLFSNTLKSFDLLSKAEDVTDKSTETSEETETKLYNTSIKDWKVKLTSGETLQFKTPENSYSLTDQYLYNIGQAYGVEDVTSESMIVVGDSEEATKCSIVLNANSFSGLEDMLKQVYGDEFNKDTMIESEAFTFMKTGKLPDELPLNYEVEEVAEYKVNGVTYKAFEVNYDTEYEIPADDENSEATVETVHTTQISCYSDTDDTMEIVLYQDEYSREESLEYLEKFLNKTN